MQTLRPPVPAESYTVCLRREAERLYLRYAVEIVERLRICPWAAEARQAGHVRLQVVAHAADPAEAAADAIEALAQDPQVDIGLVILPELTLDRLGFERFVARLRAAHAARHPLGACPFALADFHPDGPLDTTTPERVVPFLRRTPDPTVQLVRKRRLDEVRRGSDQGTALIDVHHLADLTVDAVLDAPAPLHERIARANQRTLERVGAAQVASWIEDIQADRTATYAALRAAWGRAS